MDRPNRRFADAGKWVGLLTLAVAGLAVEGLTFPLARTELRDARARERLARHGLTCERAQSAQTRRWDEEAWASMCIGWSSQKREGPLVIADHRERLWLGQHRDDVLDGFLVGFDPRGTLEESRLYDRGERLGTVVGWPRDPSWSEAGPRHCEEVNSLPGGTEPCVERLVAEVANSGIRPVVESRLLEALRPLSLGGKVPPGATPPTVSLWRAWRCSSGTMLIHYGVYDDDENRRAEGFAFCRQADRWQLVDRSSWGRLIRAD